MSQIDALINLYYPAKYFWSYTMHWKEIGNIKYRIFQDISGILQSLLYFYIDTKQGFWLNIFVQDSKIFHFVKSF